MKHKEENLSEKVKLKVIPETLRERSILVERSQRYDLHRNQISKWKADFLVHSKQLLCPVIRIS